MGLHLCSLRNLSSFYDSLNSSPGILTESDFSLSYSSPCQPKESDLSLACHFQNRSPGFRSGRSCETQLVTIFQDLAQMHNKKGSQIDIAVLDFSKAFDMVPHDGQLFIDKMNDQYCRIGQLK